LNLLIRHRTDGLLLAPAHSENRSLANMLDKLSTPSVTFDRLLYDSAVPSVVSNNYKGAKAATEHLIMHGCNRILCLGGETDLYTIKERIRGYKEGIKQAGLDAIIDTSIKDYKSAESAIESHFYSSNPPDAVFALKNLATIYACEVFQKLNISVPKKVALIGFDDFELASTLRPSISVVRQPSEDIGRIATELLFDQLMNPRRGTPSHGDKAKPQHIKLENRLVLRNSCGCKIGTN
jgi:LacI family transcriptional regulator